MKTNYQKAVEIYQKGGQYAVYNAVEAGILKADSMRDCTPCEDRTPHDGNTCLVCGTTNAWQPESENQDLVQTIDHKIRFASAWDCSLWLSENDIELPVTLTLHLGA